MINPMNNMKNTFILMIIAGIIVMFLGGLTLAYLPVGSDRFYFGIAQSILGLVGTIGGFVGFRRLGKL